MTLSKQVQTKDAYLGEICRTALDEAMGRESLPKGRLQRGNKFGWALEFRGMLEDTYEEQREADAQASTPFFNQRDSAGVSFYISGLYTSGFLKMLKLVSSFSGGK